MADGEKKNGLSDALVFFGATGDLAYKKIFPALHALARRGRLDMVVVGVARSEWTREQLVGRARASIAETGSIDEQAFARLAAQLHYVSVDYESPAGFAKLRAALGDVRRPAFYLAIPPSSFPAVLSRLSEAGCSTNSRVILEKPFGRDLQSARALNQT